MPAVNARRTARRALAAFAAVALLAACGGSGEGIENQPDFAGDGDSGAAAPATQITPDNPAAGDSTTGLSPQRAGEPGVAGTRQTKSDTTRVP